MTGPNLFGELEGLTERQLTVLRELARVEGGLDAGEAGAVWHERRGKHERGLRCEYCTVDGRSVLWALRKKGLVSRRLKTGMFHLTETGRRALDAGGECLTTPLPPAPSGAGVGYLPHRALGQNRLSEEGSQGTSHASVGPGVASPADMTPERPPAQLTQGEEIPF